MKYSMISHKSLWKYAFKHAYLPEFLLFSLFALICIEAIKNDRNNKNAAEETDDQPVRLQATSENEDQEIKERTFAAEVDQLGEVIAFAEEELERHGASMKVTMTVSVALEEMFVNIAHYAYPGSKGTAKIRLAFADDTLSIELIDKGIEFDPLSHKDPDVTARLEDRSIGGLGIYMVKKSMDHCEYFRRDDENHFIMKKKIR